jgi:hypothetical protein
MKTKLFSIVTMLVLVAGFTSATYASTSNNNVATVLTNISRINKIEIRGNVELYVSAGNADQVKVYNKYYAETALVQNQNGVLRISSYKAEKLVVWVTVNDLRAISAYDNAQVKSFGNLSLIDLEVNLYNNATAKLNVDTYSTSISMNDNAKMDLSGTSSVYSLTHNKASSVNNNNFVATTYTDILTNGINAKKEVTNDLAGL